MNWANSSTVAWGATVRYAQAMRRGLRRLPSTTAGRMESAGIPEYFRKNRSTKSPPSSSAKRARYSCRTGSETSSRIRDAELGDAYMMRATMSRITRIDTRFTEFSNPSRTVRTLLLSVALKFTKVWEPPPVRNRSPGFAEYLRSMAALSIPARSTSGLLRRKSTAQRPRLSRGERLRDRRESAGRRPSSSKSPSTIWR